MKTTARVRTIAVLAVLAAAGALAQSDPAVLVALPHTFWYHFEFPETREALEVMAHFLDQKVAH